MKKLFVAMGAATLLFLSGCATNMMKPSASETIQSPVSDKATIVFMRKSIVLAAIGVEMFEVVDGKLEFIGNLSTGNKFAHQTTPGKKVYMAYGSAADFMIADVRAGKTYYSIVRPNWGTGGFAPTPIRKSDGETNMKSPEFAEWVKGTQLQELKKEEAAAWFEKNREKYEEIYAKYWKRFQNKDDAEKYDRTLFPADGV